MPVARRGAESWLAAKRLGVPHLPQGAPTSPALANCVFQPIVNGVSG